MVGLIITFKDDTESKIKYDKSDEYNGPVGFTFSNDGLVILNGCGEWLRWISLDEIKEFRQYYSFI